MFFFFFKQKTAYEMRISDWSSDVCSSDLAVAAPDHSAGAAGRIPGPSWAERRERFARRLGRWLRKNAMSFYVAMFFLVLGMIMLAPKIFITIPAGHVRVMWYRFLGGTALAAPYAEGMHVIFPWDEMYARSEESRVGKGCVSTCESRWS